MTANAPASKLPGALSLPLQILGAFVIIACVVGLWVKRDRPDSLLCYLLGFGCIVFAYPWNDATALVAGSAVPYRVRATRTEAHGLTRHLAPSFSRLLFTLLHAWTAGAGF